MLLRAFVFGSAAVVSVVLALGWFTSGAEPRPALAVDDMVSRSDGQYVAGSSIGSEDPLIDVWVTKADLPDPVLKDGLLTYTIVVGNHGPDVATQVTLADPLPAGTTFASVITTQGTCTGGSLVTCNVGAVPTGSTATITFVVRPTVTGLITNTVTVIGTEPESNTANNQATATTWVPLCAPGSR
jgi:uncharacterized repeat protein (TIGR01451 family)